MAGHNEGIAMYALSPVWTAVGPFPLLDMMPVIIKTHLRHMPSAAEEEGEKPKMESLFMIPRALRRRCCGSFRQLCLSCIYIRLVPHWHIVWSEYDF